MSDKPEKQRTRLVWWTRKFGEPLRANFPVDLDMSEEFIDLLDQADRRIDSDNKPSSPDHSEGA
jgi:hypothetical protein